MTTAAMKTANAASTTSGMRDDDALDHVRRVLARVDRLFEQRIHILPLDDVHRIASAGEQIGYGLPRDSITLVLQAMNLDPVVLDVLERVELLERPYDLLALLHDDRRLLRRRVRRCIDLVENARVRHLLDEVEDVVQPAKELMNVV